MKLAGTLEKIQEPNGPKGASSKEDQEACKFELSQTQEMLKEARKAQGEALAKTYKFLRNLLSGNPQSQWDWICLKMHERDSWAEGQILKTLAPTWKKLELNSTNLKLNYKKSWLDCTKKPDPSIID